MSDLKPFLATIATGHTSARSLGTALPVHAMPEAMSPWTPKPEPAPAPPPIDLETVRAEALAAGREEGKRETAALRGKLRILVDALQAARDGLASPAADLIADAATAVVAAGPERGDH